uniref:Uncharacterized protein n=1 Tax=Oryza meridionalis TaxID=40149 RepID=A0A0E0BWU2_9ORYZ
MAHQPMPCHAMDPLPKPPSPRRRDSSSLAGHPHRRQARHGNSTCASIRPRGARFPDGPAGCRSISSSAQHEDPIGQWQTWTSVD